ncbi:hypothetical protein [Micromonospora sp. NPDC048830]|uniref:hypothetical protein n=1 Tax=Micromonospora sp. NPDC048830 TaxID=3364257 RepID=UPI00371A46AC
MRTPAAGQRPYNPVGAHVGAVWPSDNAIIAAGLRRYGCDEAAARIAAGIFDVVEAMGSPVPEAIAGYDRDLTDYPVRLPNAGRDGGTGAVGVAGWVGPGGNGRAGVREGRPAGRPFSSGRSLSPAGPVGFEPAAASSVSAHQATTLSGAPAAATSSA